MLEREQLPRPPEAGLHLVDGEERAVAAAQLLRAFQVTGRGQVDAVALNRLDQEERDLFSAQLALESVEVAEGNLEEAGQERAKPLDEVAPAVGGERAERQAVEAV